MHFLCDKSFFFPLTDDGRGVGIWESALWLTMASGANMFRSCVAGNVKYRPRGEGGGFGGGDAPLGADAAARTRGGVVDWGHLKGGDKVRNLLGFGGTAWRG